jgi:hypothetical protein
MPVYQKYLDRCFTNTALPTQLYYFVNLFFFPYNLDDKHWVTMVCIQLFACLIQIKSSQNFDDLVTGYIYYDPMDIVATILAIIHPWYFYSIICLFTVIYLYMVMNSPYPKHQKTLLGLVVRVRSVSFSIWTIHP